MISRNRVLAILKLALPISIGMSSSFIMALVDLAMVGSLGNAALAALGLSTFSNTLILAFVIGVTPAVQGMVARRRGENSPEPKCLPLNAGLLFALAVAIPLSIICFLLAPFLFSIISSDPEVTEMGVPYLRALSTAAVAVGMNCAFHGHWNGSGKVKIFMLNVLFVNILNIVLNYAFIFGHFGAPTLGAFGAGVASAISLYVGVLVYFVVTVYQFKGEGFLTIKPKMTLLGKIFQIGMPATFQQVFFSLGYIIFYWIVGQIGTDELAVINVLVRIALLLAIFAEALGATAATLVSNTLGKGDPEGAAAWGWDIGKLGVAWITLLGMPLLLFPHWVLSFFLADANVISVAIIPTQLAGALTGITSLIIIFAIPLVSLGDGKRVLLVSFCTQWFFFLPVVWLVGPYLNYGLLGVSLVQYVYGLMAASLITALWRGGRWKKIAI